MGKKISDWKFETLLLTIIVYALITAKSYGGLQEKVGNNIVCISQSIKRDERIDNNIEKLKDEIIKLTREVSELVGQFKVKEK